MYEVNSKERGYTQLYARPLFTFHQALPCHSCVRDVGIIEHYEVDNVDRTTCRLGPCSHSYLCTKMDVD